MKRAACWISLLALLGLSTPAAASVVARERVSLGALSDESDRVVIARVRAATPRVQLEVERTLKGAHVAVVELPASEHVLLQVGERALFFLRGRDPADLRPLVTPFQRVAVTDNAAASELTDAVQSRLPRLGGNPAALPAALFDQLRARLVRVREDAAWDLLTLRRLQPDASQQSALKQALDAGVNEPLLLLAERFPHQTLLPAVQLAQRGADPHLAQLAARALDAIDPSAALAAASRDLLGPNLLRARSAVHLAGHLGGGAQLLQDALLDARPQVREAALRALATRDLGAAEVAALERHLTQTTQPREAAQALAVLALAGEGQALLRAEQTHPDPATRRLARELRAEPLPLARDLLQ
ncbi:MAG TPA: hypothetical protein DEA08_19025 [Planctomycetes bacterium]|nr:hypothetical protein [Planctomycetota bacterium]